MSYATMVARSRSATGPFETLEQAEGVPSSVIVEKNEGWIGPGHNSVVRDANGTDWIVYHAVDVRKPRTTEKDEVNTRRIMLIDPLTYVDGWPRLPSGPSSGPRPAPILPR